MGLPGRRSSSWTPYDPACRGAFSREAGAPWHLAFMGRSTLDLLHTLRELEARRVSVVALNGLAFDLGTPHGQMMTTVLAGVAEFERELIIERVGSGLAAAKARGKRLGHQPGQRPSPTALAPNVLSFCSIMSASGSPRPSAGSSRPRSSTACQLERVLC